MRLVVFIMDLLLIGLAVWIVYAAYQAGKLSKKKGGEHGRK